MTLPALDLLAANGYALTLVGRPWAADLFAAYAWSAVSLSGSRWQHVRTLRNSGVKSGLLMTNSFSTALEFRLAGISTTAYASDGRSWLLGKAVPVAAADHMVEHYYRLARELVRAAPTIPPDINLQISNRARKRAHELLSAHGAGSRYVVLCPVATGLHRGKVKAWGGFERLCRELLESGLHVVALPGPNETATVRNALPGAIVLPEADLSTFSAILENARLVIANDSGPGHLAAAAGTRLISVFGVTEPQKTRPWSSKATLIGTTNGWPHYEDVRAAIDTALRD